MLFLFFPQTVVEVAPVVVRGWLPTTSTTLAWGNPASPSVEWTQPESAVLTWGNPTRKPTEWQS